MQTINILLSTFTGLGAPPTLVVQEDASASISELIVRLLERLPCSDTRLIFTTTSNKQLHSSCSAPISSLLSSAHDDFLPVRLSVPVCGGKGGFGSQLRAAGGRMSSRRTKNQGENNGSNRNLDGRRLRTVTEAKALAEYLALKPEMEKKQKEERRRRWEQIIELAERKEQEMRTGAKARVDGKWVEEKDEAGERTREAVLAAMKSGDYHDNLVALNALSNGESEAAELVRETSLASASSSDGEEAGSSSRASSSSSATSASDSHTKQGPPSARRYIGFDDDDDEFMSDDDDSENEEGQEDEEMDEDDDTTAEGEEME